MNRKPYTSYNTYFFVPFLVWIIAGGVALLFFDNQVLFTTFNTHHSSFWDTIMLHATRMGEGVVIIVVLLILLAISTLRNWWYVVAALLSNVIPALVTQAVKRSVDAPRPLKFFEEAPWIHTLPEWPRLMERSFPSGHTTGAFCLFCFLSVLLPPRYRKYGLVFFALALLVGYSRIYLAAHFFIDVYVGSIIGTFFTTAVIAVMNRYEGFFFRKA